MIKRRRLRREQRLGTDDVSAVLKIGAVSRSPRWLLYQRPNLLPRARLALIVPKKLVPTAVRRNRVRRLAREAFRARQEELNGTDCVLRLIKPLETLPPSLVEIDALFAQPHA